MSTIQTESESFAVFHDELQLEVMETLKADWNFADLTYHNTQPTDIVNQIQRCQSPATRQLRGRSDLLAIHKRYPKLALWIECKTNDGSYPNFAMELMPLISHFHEAELYDVITMYVYKDLGNPSRTEQLTRIVGVTAEELSLDVSRIIIPDSTQDIAYYRSKARRVFPNVNAQIKHVKGSGDPFAIVNYECVQRYETYTNAIYAIVNGYADSY